MTTTETFRKSDKAPQDYKTKDGTRVPGVTTIVNVLNKPALVKWANNMGLQGIDTNKYVDSLATAGTLAHYLVECELTAMIPDPFYLAEFSDVDRSRADNSMMSFYAWQKQHEIKVVGHELELVSEEHRFGGTCDVLAEIDGEMTLVDIKTCKALYGPTDEKWTQVAGYHLLLTEAGYAFAACRILRIGREESEGFEYADMPRPTLQRERFLACLKLYRIEQELKAKA